MLMQRFSSNSASSTAPVLMQDPTPSAQDRHSSAAPKPAQPAAESQPASESLNRQETPVQELHLDATTMFYRAGSLSALSGEC